MEKRILIKDLKNSVGQTVTVKGVVDLRRDHGKLIFIDLRDRTGKIQVIISKKQEAAYTAFSEIKNEWALQISGLVKARMENTINPEIINGDIELEAIEGAVLSRAEETPFEKNSTDVNIDTYLNYLPYTLRSDKAKMIFKIQAQIIKSYREFLTNEDFVEFQSPKIIGEDGEGGANVFTLDYFGSPAHLATSPQFYKQIMVGVYERVFSTGNVYRAEPHSTTRHLNEYTSLDLEMGFIDSHEDIMELETRLLVKIMKDLQDDFGAEFLCLGTMVPGVPAQIPAMKLREAQELIKKETGEDCCQAPDLEPAHERWLCEYAKQKWDSDFIFITHFPLSKRPMYTYEDENDKGYAKGFDLLFRGIEITTGGQRIHDYEKLMEAIKSKGLDVDKFSYYLQAFKYGMPPHGGLGMGLERLTEKLVGVENVREATLFPRDIHRIDGLLTQETKKNQESRIKNQE
jgi:nondiscriminating aspartyl-tRNA synthetase